MAGSFVDYLTRRLPLVERALAGSSGSALTDGPVAGDLERYLYRPLERFTASGGKRVRPVLCLLGAEAAGGDPEAALSCAVAVELFQSAALVHDDIADEGELRRGEPCLHRVEGEGLAINAGDLALEFCRELAPVAPEVFEARYGISPVPEDPLALIEEIALARGCRARGGEPDYERASRLLIDDFRKGRLGKIMLEKPESGLLRLKTRT